MLGYGLEEIILLLVVCLIVFGPGKLPEFARALGRAVAEFKRATNEIKNAVNQDETVREFKREFQSAQHRVMLSSSFTNPLDSHPSVTESPPSGAAAASEEQATGGTGTPVVSEGPVVVSGAPAGEGAPVIDETSPAASAPGEPSGASPSGPEAPPAGSKET